jgi:hypothetical protein
MISEFESPAVQEKIGLMKAQGFDVQWLSGLCPVQATGYIDGHPFYWRARGTMWSIQIAYEAGEYSDVLIDSPASWQYMERYGEFPDAGYMPFIEALGFIEAAANRWRSRS